MEGRSDDERSLVEMEKNYGTLLEMRGLGLAVRRDLPGSHWLLGCRHRGLGRSRATASVDLVPGCPGGRGTAKGNTETTPIQSGIYLRVGSVPER